MNTLTAYAYRCLAVTLAVIGIVMLLTDGENMDEETAIRIMWLLGSVGVIMLFLDIIPSIFSWIKNDYVNHGITAATLVFAALTVSAFSEHTSTDPNSSESKMLMVIIFGIIMSAAYLLIWWLNKKKQEKEDAENSEEISEEE